MLTALQHITGHAVDEAKKASLDEAKRSGDSTLWERNELIVRCRVRESEIGAREADSQCGEQINRERRALIGDREKRDTSNVAVMISDGGNEVR
jgi:hypothetical protein